MKVFLQRLQQFVASQPMPTIPVDDDAMIFPVYSYGQQNSGLELEEIQPIMEWVSCSVYRGTQYTGKSHLFWLLPSDDIRRDLQRLYQKGEKILGYRCGEHMASAPDGLYWRIVEEHPSTRIYRLEAQKA